MAADVQKAAQAPSKRRAPWAAPALVGALVLALYMATTQRSVGAFDSAELAAGSASLGIVHAPGYPLYLLLGHAFSLIPLGEVAFRVNLMSGVFGAASVALLILFYSRLTGSPAASALAAAAFGVSLPVWKVSVVAEVYTLQALILSGVLLLALRLAEAPSLRRLAILSLVAGLTLAHRPPEMLAIIGLPVALWPGPARRLLSRPRAVLIAALGVVAGLAWYAYLPLRAASHPALDYTTELQVSLTTLQGIWWMISGAMFRHLLFAYTLPEYFGELLGVAGLVWRAWYGVGGVLGLIGIVRMAQRSPAWAGGLGVMGVVTATLYAGYRVPDKSEMFLPVLVIWAAFMAEGLAFLFSAAARAAARAALAGAFGLLVAGLIATNFPQADLSRSHLIRDQAAATLSAVPHGAIVLADWPAATPLKYLQVVERQRQDVLVFDWGLYSLGRLAYYRQNHIPTQAAYRFMQRDLACAVVDLSTGSGTQRPVVAIDEYEVLRGYFVATAADGLFRLEWSP
jgi:hypothetical protein